MEVNLSPVAEGVDGAASAWVADECSTVLGQELSPEEEEQHAELVQAAKIEAVGAWKKFELVETKKGPRSLESGYPNAAAD